MQASGQESRPARSPHTLGGEEAEHDDAAEEDQGDGACASSRVPEDARRHLFSAKLPSRPSRPPTLSSRRLTWRVRSRNPMTPRKSCWCSPTWSSCCPPPRSSRPCQESSP